MGLTASPARWFTGVITIRRFDSDHEKADFNPSGLQPILRTLSEYLCAAHRAESLRALARVARVKSELRLEAGEEKIGSRSAPFVTTSM